MWPQALDPATPPSLGFLLRIEAPALAMLATVQDGRTLWRSQRRRLTPNRSIGAPPTAIAGLDPRGGPVSWRLA